MVKINRAASIPLILSDPYFSIWSPADQLYACDTESWTGNKRPIRGYVKVNNQVFRFMGEDQIVPIIPQVSLEVTATQTAYEFSNEWLDLTVTFSTNLDLANLQKISEPVTMISTAVKKKQPDAAIEILWQFSDTLCQDSSAKLQSVINWNTIQTEQESLAWFGKAQQSPLNATGDLIDIDWGYFYLAANAQNRVVFTKNNQFLEAAYTVEDQVSFLAAYDDIYAINYFGEAKRGLWKEKYATMFDLLHAYLQEIEENLASCASIDRMIETAGKRCGGETLDFITAFSYRQSICAHKLIRDSEGELVFLSKECSSNGCIGTSDISYPSIPLFLLYQPELVKGMLRPIYKFAELPVWEFDFAPHDVGRYPYVTGQVYSENRQSEHDGSNRGAYDTVFDLFSLPAGQQVYEEQYQMPIEESGNMLIMICLTYIMTEDSEFFKRNLETNRVWADYLLKHGQDPANQLCTDDFAGHLAHNANLSLKAIVALALFGKVLMTLQLEGGREYYEAAKKMAPKWEETAAGTQHTKLAFDQEESWSLKYNIVWDKLLSLGLFNQELLENEVSYYLTQENRYGIPLDNRADYTKADWLMWVAALTDNPENAERIIQPVRSYLENTTTRVPFSDWYDTKTGRMVNFKNRSVVGAMFMLLLKEKLEELEISL